MQIKKLKVKYSGGPTLNCEEMCPSNLGATEFLGKIVHGLLFTPSSERLVAIPCSGQTIDKNLVEEIEIEVER